MRAEIRLHGRSWRGELRGFLQKAKSELILVCPYIRESEAKFVTGELSEKIRIFTFTSLSADSITSDALEIRGIERLARFSPESKAINLPRLHAKIFVADNLQAIITSANLTTSGIDRNYEYGVVVNGRKTVSEILSDLEKYQKIGTEIKDFHRINNLAKLAKKAHQKTERKTSKENRELREAFNSLEHECIAIQVGEKSETGLFSDALRYVLTSGPAKTVEIQTAIRKIYPQLCGNKGNRIINGRTFGKLWKHHLRNAQQGMKRRDEIKYNRKSGLWSLV